MCIYNKPEKLYVFQRPPFCKGGEVCFVFLTGNFRRFSPNGVGSYKLPYLIRKGLGECWKLLVDGGGGLNYNDYIIYYKNNDVYKFIEKTMCKCFLIIRVNILLHCKAQI